MSWWAMALMAALGLSGFFFVGLEVWRTERLRAAKKRVVRQRRHLEMKPIPKEFTQKAEFGEVSLVDTLRRASSEVQTSAPPEDD